VDFHSSVCFNLERVAAWWWKPPTLLNSAYSSGANRRIGGELPRWRDVNVDVNVDPDSCSAGDSRYMEIEMKIRTIMMDPDANTPVVVLKDVNSETMLPIWIGAFEANAIAVEIEKTAAPRPTTHDLMKNIIRELGVTVRRIIITDLVDNTFFAVIEMSRDGELMMIDSRPSDAIALALRVDCPIYVDQQVIDNSASHAVEEPSTAGEDDWPDDLIDDATHYKM